MPRLLALIAIALLLPACAAPPPPPVAASSLSSQPTAQPSVTAAPPTALPPTPQPSATAVPPTPAPPTPALPHYDLVLTGGTLISGAGDAPLPNATVAIAGGRIAAAGPADSVSYSADTPVRDISGATIMPGFVNAHVHISGLGEDDLRAWPRAGVTTVLDLAGPIEERVPLRNSFRERGDASLPRLLVSGPIVSVAGGYPFGVRDEHLRVAAVAVSGPEHASAEVAALADAGVDQIKIAVSGRTDVSWPELSDAELAAITATARARGLAVTAHVDRASALRRAVLAGVNNAAHSPRDRIPDDLIALMVERGVRMVPTIVVYEDLAKSRGRGPEWRRQTMPTMYDNLRRFVAAGGTIALGDDFGGVPGMPVGMPMDEINHWIAAGLTPMQVIEAATRGGAAFAGLEAELGTVEPGKAADLLVVAGDPLTDITALARPLLVVHDGQLVTS